MKTLAARLALLSAFLALPVLAGCSADKDYVAADHATYDALAPAIKRDAATLPDDDKARELRTLATWELRIRKAEGK